MNQTTVAPRLPSLNPIRKAMAHLSVYAGLSLVPLLFVGMYLGLRTFWFDYLFFAHLAILGAALAATVLFFWRIVHRAELSILVTLGGFLIFLFIIALESSHPITSRDALIHHLAVPKWWLEAGKIVPIPWHEWSFYPMLLQLGFTGLMKFGLVQWTPLYHFCFLLLMCGVVASFVLYKTQSYDSACLGFLICLSIPVCVKLASTPLVDLGLALYMGQALCHLVYWTEGKRKNSHLLLAGAAMGLALSCKYNALLACLVAFVAMLVYARRSGVTFGALFSLSFICISTAVLVYFPWLLRNATWTNNPFYPLLNNLFAVSKSASGPGGLSPLAQRLMLYQENWWEVLSIPLQMLFLGQDGNPRRFDGVLSPILLFALVPLYRLRKEPWVLFFWIFCALYFAFALLLSSARVRYLAPLFAPAIALSAVGIWHAGKLKAGKFAREWNLGALSFALLWSGWHAGDMLATSGAVPYLQGTESAQQYLRARIAEYPAIEYVNRNVPEGSTVYLLNTGNRFYYFDKRVFSSGHYSSGQLLRWIKEADNADFLTTELRNRGIDYLMTNTALTQTALSDFLDEPERAVWNDFQTRHLELKYVSGAFSIWQIRSGAGQPK
ncbi:MAG: hypothetical protein J0M12_05740 [Deltaproteobacteria bacterium]|nr:hypothetical protein [Deltaproteobacteria bacterium]